VRATDGEGEWLFEAGYPGYAAHWLAFRGLRALNQLYCCIVLALAAASLLRWARRPAAHDPWAISGSVLVAYLSAISMAFSRQSQVHYPLMRWIAMCAGVAGVRWLTARRPGLPA
jgi:hypothetical protein